MDERNGLEISTLEQLRNLDEGEVAEAQIEHSHISHGDGGAIEIAEDVFGAMNRSFHNIYDESLYESIRGETWDENVESIEEGMEEVLQQEISQGESDPGVYWLPERFVNMAYEAENTDEFEEELLDPWNDYQDTGLANGRLRGLTASY